MNQILWQKVRRLKRKGLNNREIGEAVGYSACAISVYLRNGNPCHHKGSCLHNRLKLALDKLDKI